MEIWKDLTGYIGIYQVSSNGRIKSLPRKIVRKNGQVAKVKETILKPGTDRYGYSFVVLCKNRTKRTTAIHRLVAAAFIPNPDNLPEIDHIDGNRANNDATNLRWCTRKQNLNYQKAINNKRETMKKVNTWFKKTGKDNHNAKPVYQYDLEGNFIKKWDCIHDAQRCGFNHGNIISCCKGRLKHYKKYIWRYE